MTVKAAACAMAIALLAGSVPFTVPAAAQNTAMPPNHAKTPLHAKRLFLSAVAVYDAGLRRGRANSANSAYLRGFRDGTSSEAYSSRAYVSQAYVVSPYSNPIRSTAGYALYDSANGYVPVASGYSSYGSYGARSVSYDDSYVPIASGYSSYGSYGTRSVSYDDGYATDRYDQGYAPRRLMDVAVAPVAPVAMPLSLEARAAHMSYCAARYQSFDPASDTFLAIDGNRYYCR